MLDSSASCHYTFELGNFDWLDYLLKDKCVSVAMANDITYVKAIGTVTIYHINSSRQQCSIIVDNVNYISSLTVQLLSLGQFLLAGYNVTSDNKSIVLTKNKKKALCFLPRWPGNLIFELQTTITVQTVSSMLFSVAHHCFAHPSLEVLRQIPKNTSLPPNFDVPKEIPICSGCSKGKITQCSFPSTLRYTSKPIELIHLDLKSFPMVLYYKYCYIIVFLNDYTSSGWLTCLSAKSTAISAIHQFLAAIETQYTMYVQQ